MKVYTHGNKIMKESKLLKTYLTLIYGTHVILPCCKPTCFFCPMGKNAGIVRYGDDDPMYATYKCIVKSHVPERILQEED